LKITQILPEFHEGGIERYVLWLSNSFVKHGHEVTVITAGGKLEEKLDPKVAILRLPVHRKNLFTALYCAFSIARRAKKEGWEIFHAHSRVPVWITFWASILSGKPWVFTAHDRYRKNWAIRPFRSASGTICVSEAVLSHLKGYLPERAIVIRNGIPFSGKTWRNETETGTTRIIFVGRLTRRKGLHIVLQALSFLKEDDWILDVLGDGPQKIELEKFCSTIGISDKTRFHGFIDDPEEWISNSSFLVFPSLDEGLGLSLMQGLKIGIPVLASNIPAVRELMESEKDLVQPGDLSAWKEALGSMIRGEWVPVTEEHVIIPSVEEMSLSVSGFYEAILE